MSKNTYYDGYPLIDQFTINGLDTQTNYRIYDRNGENYTVTEEISPDGSITVKETGRSNNIPVKITTKYEPGQIEPISSDTTYYEMPKDRYSSYLRLKREFEKTPFEKAGITNVKDFINWGKKELKNYLEYVRRNSVNRKPLNI